MENIDAEEVRDTILRRLNGIRDQDGMAIESTINSAVYTKFDDWPPYTRQDSEALREETAALRVLKEYDYEIHDFAIDILNDSAIATFHVHYRGAIRDQSFDITSRVTVILQRLDNQWKIVHEHFSRFPTEDHPSPPPALRNEAPPIGEEITTQENEAPAEVPEIPTEMSPVREAILKTLQERGELTVIDLAGEAGNRSNRYVEASDVVKECEQLVSQDLLERTSEGFYLAKFRLKQ